MTKAAGSPWREEFHVQGFVFKKKQLTAEDPRPASGREQALRLAERLAPTRAGVVVLSCRAAPELGEYDPPKVEARHGEVPEQALELLAAA